MQGGNYLTYLQTTCGFLLVLTLSFFMTATSQADNYDLAKLFQDRGVEGTIIISSLDGKMNYVYNNSRSETRLVPASTFKIPNKAGTWDM